VSASRALARRHGIRPSKALGQHFLIDPNLARAIVADAGVRPGDRVVEVGAGLGSLTVALADADAEVLAIELDRALLPALGEVVGERVRLLRADASALDWPAVLRGDGWILCANLPYNVATPIVLDVLSKAPMVERLVVMVQREVAERLAAGPGDPAYGIPSVRVAYRATATLVRRVAPSVFWPRPRVGSAVVRIERLHAPAVSVEEEALWRVVDAGFGQRRKTMRNAIRSLGLPADEADALLVSCGVDPGIRAERLGLREFASIAEALP
jgi:16S rRNA (adenine1518-N6/adenine1519-N6)-dimethyltransferase